MQDATYYVKYTTSLFYFYFLEWCMKFLNVTTLFIKEDLYLKRSYNVICMNLFKMFLYYTKMFCYYMI